LPDATITIEKVWKGDEQEGQYGPYFKYDVQYAGGGKARYVTFKDELGAKAEASIGREVLVTYEEPTQEGRNPKITAISDPLDDSVTAAPALGTGEYVKGKDAPETRAAIAAAVALDKAVLRANSQDAVTRADVLSLADEYFGWLISKSQAATPEKPSQSLPGASEQPAGEGQITEIGQLLAVLEKQTPASPDPSWTWADEARRYTKANFEKESSKELTKAEANQLREYLEERIAAIQAEVGIPF
jgi:hypothetical protein